MALVGETMAIASEIETTTEVVIAVVTEVGPIPPKKLNNNHIMPSNKCHNKIWQMLDLT